MRGQHLNALITELVGVIQSPAVVEWHRRMLNEDYTFLKDRAADNLFKIESPAVKAYVWLLIRQELLERSTRGTKLEVADSDLAKPLGVPSGRLVTYREELTKLGLVGAQPKRPVISGDSGPKGEILSGTATS